jgi:hypothetical protein
METMAHRKDGFRTSPPARTTTLTEGVHFGLTTEGNRERFNEGRDVADRPDEHRRPASPVLSRPRCGWDTVEWQVTLLSLVRRSAPRPLLVTSGFSHLTRAIASGYGGKRTEGATMESEATEAAGTPTPVSLPGFPVKLPNGTILRVSGPALSGGTERDVADRLPKFDEVTKIIEGIGDGLHSVAIKLKPEKLTVEFGLEISVESGELTALLVKGSGTAHLTVELEWKPGKARETGEPSQNKSP